MKRTENILCILFFLGALIRVQAQDTDYTQYYQNLASINPGFTGTEDYLDMKMGFRQGWNDFNTKNNNLYFSVNGSLNKTKQLLTTNNSLRISNPSLYNEIQSDKKLRRKHGLGGIITNKNFGPYRSLDITTNYAYHLPISRKFNISMGTKLSYNNQRINFNGYTVRDEINDLFYQQIIKANQGNDHLINMDFGAALYSPNFYFGISSTGMITKMITGENLLNHKADSRISAQTAGNFSLGSNFMLSPGMKFTYSKHFDLLWAGNLRMRYKQLLYIGSGFNSEKKLSLLLGLSLNDRVNLNYSYDQYLSELNDFNATMHEIVLGVCLFRTYGMKTKFW